MGYDSKETTGEKSVSSPSCLLSACSAFDLRTISNKGNGKEGLTVQNKNE